MIDGTEPPGVAARRAREAERLRENLHRRKAQARARREAASTPVEEESRTTAADDTAASSERS